MQFKSIFASSVLAIAAVSAQTQTTGLLGNAAVINDNPVGAKLVVFCFFFFSRFFTIPHHSGLTRETTTVMLQTSATAP